MSCSCCCGHRSSAVLDRTHPQDHCTSSRPFRTRQSGRSEYCPEQLLEVETLSASGEPCRMYIPCVPTLSFCLLTSHRSSYDKLIIAVGSTSSTHGVAGLEHCFQLKTIGDAQNIRRRVMGIVPTVSCSITELMFCQIILRLPVCQQPLRRSVNVYSVFVICGGALLGWKLLR